MNSNGVCNISHAPAQPPVFSTGYVARVCRVAPRTVSKWFDSGKLAGYRIPGSMDRRIPLDALLRFLRSNGFAVPADLRERPLVLILGLDPLVVSRLPPLLPNHDVEAVPDLFHLGMAVVRRPPDVVVIDATIGRSEALRAGLAVRETAATARIIGVCGEDEEKALAWMAAGFAAVLRRPVGAEGLAGAVGGEEMTTE